MTKKIIRMMEKKQYMTPSVDVHVLCTARMMKAGEGSDILPSDPGTPAPRHRTDVF